MDGLSVGERRSEIRQWRGSAGASSPSQRHARSGRSMFLSLISPASMNGDADLSAHLGMDDVGGEDAARRRLAFEPGSDIDAVAEDVVPLDDDLAEIDADAELDRPLRGQVALAHRALDRDGAFDRVDDAAELDQRPVAHHLDDAAMTRGDGGIERLAPNLPQGGDRAGLVAAHHAAVAGDVGGEDGGEPPRDLLFPHTASKAGVPWRHSTPEQPGGRFDSLVLEPFSDVADCVLRHELGARVEVGRCDAAVDLQIELHDRPKTLQERLLSECAGEVARRKRFLLRRAEVEAVSADLSGLAHLRDRLGDAGVKKLLPANAPTTSPRNSKSDTIALTGSFRSVSMPVFSGPASTLNLSSLPAALSPRHDRLKGRPDSIVHFNIARAVDPGSTIEPPSTPFRSDIARALRRRSRLPMRPDRCG